jgi:hypothetical protein
VARACLGMSLDAGAEMGEGRRLQWMETDLPST